MSSYNFSMENISLSKEASNAIKGLLIVLVVLGHNSILCRGWDGCVSTGSFFHWRWLYTFHVYCFFLLPFMYNKLPYRRGNFRKYALRLLYPYVWICAACMVLSLFVMGNPFPGWTDLIQAVVCGSDKLLDETMGLNFPWFLPAMFSLLLLKDIYYSSRKHVRWMLLGIGFALWTVVLPGDVKFSTLGTYVPFALVPAFRLLPVCLLAVWLAERLESNFKSRCVVTAVFVSLSLVLWLVQTCDIRTGRMAFYFVMPVAAFLTLLQFRDWLAKSRLLIALGKMSLQIYLYHVIVFNGLLLLVKHFHCPPTLTDGVVVLMVTLAVSCLGAWLTTRIPLLRNLLYPRGGK